MSINSPLRFHRVEPLFEFPTSTRLGDIAQKLISDDRDTEGRIVQFQLLFSNESLESSSITLEELVQRNGTEIIDLAYSIKSGSPYSEEQPLDQVPPILELFTKQGGLPSLIKLLFNFCMERISKENAENSDLAKWGKWLEELNVHAQITGYPETFVSNADCRSLLLEAMRALRDSEDSTRRKQTLFENPFEPLYNTLYVLFSKAATNMQALRMVKHSDPRKTKRTNILKNNKSKRCPLALST